MNLIRKSPRRRAVAAGLGLSFWTLAAMAQNAAPHAGLMKLYAEALESNQTYQARLSEFRIVAESEAQAQGKLLPQVGVRGSYDYVHEDIEGEFFGLVDVENEDDFPAGLFGAQLTQALYRPELWIERDQARTRVAQARFGLDEAEDGLMLKLATAYFAVLAAQDNVRLTGAEQEALRRQHDQIKGRYSAGLATEADFQSARAQLALIEAKYLDVKTKVDAAYAALDVVVGTPVRGLRVLPDTVTLAPPQPPSVEAWIERAREQNLEVVRLRLGLDVSEQEAEKARRLRWPKIDLVGRGFYLDSGGGLTGERNEIEGRIGVALTLPIYSGGQVSSAIRQADEGRSRSQALLQQAQAEAARDAHVAFLNTQVGAARIPALKTAVDAARAAEVSTKAGFEAGTLTAADTLRAVEDRYTTERDYAAARYKFMLDTLALKFAAGNLTNADLTRFDRLLRAPTP